MTRTLYDYDSVLRRFRKDTEDHVMRIRLDDGLYRHALFCRPQGSRYRSMYWYELITTPGQLTIRGDMGTYVFSRLNDMFEFFRSGRGINPGYWGEKLSAISTLSGYREYSQDVARKRIREYFDDRKHGIDDPDELWEDIDDEVLNDDVLADETQLRNALNWYKYPDSAKKKTIFEFSDVWEWDLRDYTYHYLWCCHAVREGIAQWDSRNTITPLEKAVEQAGGRSHQ